MRLAPLTRGTREMSMYVPLCHAVHADDGTTYKPGTLVEVDPDYGDDPLEVIERAEFHESGVDIILPNGEYRRVEPDCVDLFWGAL